MSIAHKCFDIRWLMKWILLTFHWYNHYDACMPFFPFAFSMRQSNRTTLFSLVETNLESYYYLNVCLSFQIQKIGRVPFIDGIFHCCLCSTLFQSLRYMQKKTEKWNNHRLQENQMHFFNLFVCVCVCPGWRVFYLNTISKYLKTHVKNTIRTNTNSACFAPFVFIHRPHIFIHSYFFLLCCRLTVLLH